MKILIAEDTEDARVLLADQLHVHGYDVECAVNGIEALAKARRSPPDVIVSDILMPEMDGFELCRQIKRDPQLNSLPFIFYTATYTDARDEHFALSLGASRFVVKPADPADFLQIIEEVLAEHAANILPVPHNPTASDDVLEHMHVETLSSKLDKKIHELETQKEHLQLITDAMPVLMSDIGPDFRYRYVNKAYEDWFHVPRLEIIGRHVRDIVGEEVFHIYESNMGKALKGESITFEVELPVINNNKRFIQAKYIPHALCKENGTGFFELVNDISDRKQAERELLMHREHLEELVAERTAQLDASNKELETFCYTVSHDLRSPLRTVSGFCQILQEDYASSIDADGQDYLVRIRKNVHHMGELIDDLLALARLSSCELSQDTVNLSALARDVVELIQHNYPDVEAKCSIEDGLSVTGDAALLRVVLENLFDNAWKFSANSKNPVIKFGSVMQDNQTVFYISDNGAGFSMDNSDKLFGAFQRLHDKEEFSGTGIGLASVKRIIQRHGGAIWAEGEPGEGATFYFTILKLRQ